jgi:chromosome segregation ATPase
MPAKKTASRSRSRAIKQAGSRTGGVGAGQLKQLRSTIDQLRKRLESEAKKHKIDLDFAKQAKQAREQVVKQVNELKARGQKLATELKKALTDSTRAQKAREEAMEKISELKAQLSHRTEELRRKTAELAELARESAGRARDIITSEGPGHEMGESHHSEEGIADVEIESDYDPSEDSEI